jgi:hypothetical protein
MRRKTFWKCMWNGEEYEKGMLKLSQEFRLEFSILVYHTLPKALTLLKMFTRTHSTSFPPTPRISHAKVLKKKVPA